MCPSVTAPDAVRTLVEHATLSELPALAGELARGLAEVLARTAASSMPVTVVSTRQQADTLLTVNEAAGRLGVPRSWLYRHAKTLPFTRKLSHRKLRFDPGGLELWVSTRARR